MPKSVKAFACSFGCARRVTTKRKDMEAHEQRCFHNPAQRACQTCANFKVGDNTVYVPHFIHEVGDCDIEEKFHYCEVEIDIEKSLKHHCPHWVYAQPAGSAEE
jgi:hypothetical protein